MNLVIHVKSLEAVLHRSMYRKGPQACPHAHVYLHQFTPNA